MCVSRQTWVDQEQDQGCAGVEVEVDPPEEEEGSAEAGGDRLKVPVVAEEAVEEEEDRVVCEAESK